MKHPTSNSEGAYALITRCVGRAPARYRTIAELCRAAHVRANSIACLRSPGEAARSVPDDALIRLAHAAEAEVAEVFRLLARRAPSAADIERALQRDADGRFDVREFIGDLRERISHTEYPALLSLSYDANPPGEAQALIVEGLAALVRDSGLCVCIQVPAYPSSNLDYSWFLEENVGDGHLAERYGDALRGACQLAQAVIDLVGGHENRVAVLALNPHRFLPDICRIIVPSAFMEERVSLVTMHPKAQVAMRHSLSCWFTDHRTNDQGVRMLHGRRPDSGTHTPFATQLLAAFLDYFRPTISAWKRGNYESLAFADAGQPIESQRGGERKSHAPAGLEGRREQDWWDRKPLWAKVKLVP